MRFPSDPLAANPSPVSRRWTRVLALGLAIAVWIVIREAISQESVVYDVPVEFLHNPEYAVLDRSVETVDVRFRGARGDLVRLQPDEIRVTADVREIRESKADVRIKLRTNMVRAPGAARAISITPGEITLSMDRQGSLDIPVRAELQDHPPDGFAVERVVCDPATVKLIGPMSKVGEIEALSTSAIELEGRTRSFKARATMQPPPGLTTVRIEPERVQVEVVITEHSATRRMEQVPVRLMSMPVAGGARRITVTPAAVAVTLQGRESALAAVSPENIMAFVDCSRLTGPGKYDFTVQWVAPSGVRAVQVEPASVTIGVSE
ncbi:MAG: hypothetical protein KBA51_00980 [Kiritimatiellae bacterium]|nr:hypothetical protein [Kiritimatiellia bacterium]